MAALDISQFALYFRANFGPLGLIRVPGVSCKLIKRGGQKYAAL